MCLAVVAQEVTKKRTIKRATAGNCLRLILVKEFITFFSLSITLLPLFDKVYFSVKGAIPGEYQEGREQGLPKMSFRQKRSALRILKNQFLEVYAMILGQLYLYRRRHKTVCTPERQLAPPNRISPISFSVASEYRFMRYIFILRANSFATSSTARGMVSNDGRLSRARKAGNSRSLRRPSKIPLIKDSYPQMAFAAFFRGLGSCSRFLSETNLSYSLRACEIRLPKQP